MAIRNSMPQRAWLLTMLIAATAMAGTSSVPSHAKTWPSPGGWQIIEGDDHCAIYRDYEGKGETELIVFLHVDGHSTASLTNTAWSASKGEKYELSWDVNGNRYKGSAMGLGERYSTRKGFAGKFGAEFVDDVAAGSSLHVYRGDVVVDRLSLDGSGAAVNVARRCVQTVRASIAAVVREKQRFAHIPDDPFAGGATKEEAAKHANDPPRPLGSALAWVTNDDYPARAMREEREGAATYLLTIAPAGTVSKCEIIASSGHADLDAETCKVVQRRGRFTEISPGSADRYFEQTMNWRLPR